jgi:hypothetical protein
VTRPVARITERTWFIIVPLACIAYVVLASEIRRRFPDILPSPNWHPPSITYVWIVTPLYDIPLFAVLAIIVSQPINIVKFWRAGRVTARRLTLWIALYLLLVAACWLFGWYGHLFPPHGSG